MHRNVRNVLKKKGSRPKPGARSRLASIAPPALFLAIIFIDHAIKAWCSTHLKLYGKIPLIGRDFLSLSRSINLGIAGDTFSNVPEGFNSLHVRYVPTLVWALVAAVAFYRFRKAGGAERYAFVALLAGGASNLYDHWVGQGVVDTFQIYKGAEEYIPFNFADVAIVAAGGILVYTFIRELICD